MRIYSMNASYLLHPNDIVAFAGKTGKVFTTINGHAVDVIHERHGHTIITTVSINQVQLVSRFNSSNGNF